MVRSRVRVSCSRAPRRAGIEQVFLVTYDGSPPPRDLVAVEAGGREVDRVPVERIVQTD